MSGSSNNGWGAGAGERSPFGALPVATPVATDDGFTIPKPPEDAVVVRGPKVVTDDAELTDVAPADNADDGQGMLPYVLGWTNPDADH